MPPFIENTLARIRADGIKGGKVNRDPRYAIILTLSIVVLVLSTIQASNAGFLDSIERPIFEFFNRLPALLLPFFFAITQFGAILGLPLWALLAYGIGKFRLTITLILSGTSAWLAAKIMKALIGRERPGGILDTIREISQEVFTGNGYPSGHSAFAAACILVLYFHLERKHRKYALLLLILVGVSRMYLGAHFPLDLVGGWALGAAMASIFSLVIGSKRTRISYSALKKKLSKFGHDIKSVHQLSVDARGSVPLQATTTNNKELFIKVFGKQEHAADWLFKSFRYFRYKSHLNEDAYISSKRNMEIEALGGLWARQAGVRTPKTIVMFPLGSRWVLVQELVDAKPLDSYKKIKTETVNDIWLQLSKLHGANISHRDLRAANIMVRPDGKVYIIDFGFAEIAPSTVRKRIDIAQLLISLSLIAGVDRTVNGALKHFDKTTLKRCLPYIQKTILPAATISELKKADADILKELFGKLKRELHIQDEVEKESLKRINLRRVIIFAVVALFLYSIVPQFNEFKGSLDVLSEVNPIWLPLLLAASFMTYVFSALVIYILTNIPLKLKEVFYIQLASSFASKLVPGGVGAASLNLRYLTRSGLSVGEASGVLTAERVVGFLGIALLILSFTFLGGESISSIVSFDFSFFQIFGVVAVISIVGAVLFFFPKLRSKVSRLGKDAWQQLSELARSPYQMLFSFLAALGITTMYILCLYFSLKAVGGSLPVLQLLLVYIGAMLAKGASPTPGGLGALEVAMVASLQGFGVEPSTAYATVVLYRVATYWLPLPFGLLVYRLYLAKKLK